MTQGCVWADSCEVLIEGNYFHDNMGEGWATVLLVNYSTGPLRANRLQDNRSGCIGAGFQGYDVNLEIDYNLLVDNGGNGIYLRRSIGQITKNVLSRAYSICFNCGRGIYLRECPIVQIENNTLYENGTPDCEDRAEIYYYDTTAIIVDNVLVNTDPLPMVLCGSSPAYSQKSTADVDTLYQSDNYFWGDGTAWYESFQSGCINPGLFVDPLLCDPAGDNWFLQAGSPCVVDTTIPGIGPGGNDLHFVGFAGALPIGCGTSDVLSVTIPPDAVVSPAIAGDVYVLSGFSVTNISDQDAPVYYRLLFDGDADPDDQGDPYAFVGVSPVLEPGQSYAPPEAALVVPNVQGSSATTVTWLVAYAPALNMPDTFTTTVNFDLPVHTGPVPAFGPALHQNVPNPFNPVTTISFALPAVSHVMLRIYSVEGKLVKTLVDETRAAGLQAVDWNGRSNTGEIQSSGVYFYCLRTGNHTLTRKMLLLK